MVDIRVNPQVTPVVQPYRRAPIHLEAKLEEKLDELERKGIIERVNEPSRWVSALVPVLKANGDVRPCVNMRPANKAIVRENHPLPTCEEMWPLLKGAKIFSKLDIKDAFHQIELAPESRYITTFICKRGLMRYKRLMFGINNAPELFQKTMERVLAGCKNALVYLDDILVFGRDVKDHDENLNAVLKRLEEYNVQLNTEKLELRKLQVKFVGHVISGGGVAPACDKLEAIRKFRPPASSEELRSLLGLIAYLGRFIKDLATKAAPLRQLVIDGKWKFDWKPEHEKCFQQLKNSITSDLRLSFFDPNKETRLTVDASPVGLGAVLSQRSGEEKEEIVMFGSKTLSGPEKRYCQTEKEALAIVWAIEHFRHFLLGGSFTVVSDHKPLVYIFQPASKPCARIERWVLRLQSFEFTVIHEKGSTNLADPLSRLSAVDTSPVDFDEEADHYINAVVDTKALEGVTLEEIKEASESDEEHKALTRAVESGKWEPSVAKWKPYGGEFAMHRNLLLRSNRIFIPLELRTRVLAAAHEGHPGREKMTKRLREKVWWPTLSQDTDKISKECLWCAMVAAPNPPPPMKRRELPDGPWRDLAIDFTSASAFGKELLVIADYYSRYLDIKIQSGMTAQETIRSLRYSFAMLGFPRSITCDNGQPFSSGEFQDFCKSYGIKIFHAPPFWPQANGMVERQNRGIKKQLQISKAKGSKSWENDLMLDYLVMYRSSPHETTGKSPFELMFNRQMKDKLPSLLTPVNSELDEEVRRRDTFLKEKGGRLADSRRRARDPDIQVGDKVLMKNLPGIKLTPNFGSETFTVKTKKNADCTIVSNSDGSEKRRNITALKKIPNPLPRDTLVLSQSLPQVPPDPSEPTPKRLRHPPKHLQDFVPRTILEEKKGM